MSLTLLILSLLQYYCHKHQNYSNLQKLQEKKVQKVHFPSMTFPTCKTWYGKKYASPHSFYPQLNVISMPVDTCGVIILFSKTNMQKYKMLLFFPHQFHMLHTLLMVRKCSKLRILYVLIVVDVTYSLHHFYFNALFFCVWNSSVVCISDDQFMYFKFRPRSHVLGFKQSKKLRSKYK